MGRYIETILNILLSDFHQLVLASIENPLTSIDNFPSFPFIHLFLSVWTYEFFFYSVRYDLSLLLFILALKLSEFLSSGSPCVLCLICPRRVLSTSLLSGTARFLGSSYPSLVPELESVFSLRSPGFYLFKW